MADFFTGFEDLQEALRQQTEEVYGKESAEVKILLAITPVADQEGARRIADKLRAEDAIKLLKSKFDGYEIASSIEYQNAPMGVFRATEARWFSDATWQQELVLKLVFTKKKENTGI